MRYTPVRNLFACNRRFRRGDTTTWLMISVCSLAVLICLGAYLYKRHVDHVHAEEIAYRQAKLARETLRLGAAATKPATTRATPTSRRSETPRQEMLIRRDAAIAADDLPTAAMIHAQLSQEALQRASRTQRAWMTLQNQSSKLFPQDFRSPYWTYENTGADLFGFLLTTGLRLNPDTMPALQQTLAAEAKLAPAGELCQSVQIETLEPTELDWQRKIFISSEYVKDGLLSVFERNGPNPSTARMIQVMDNILAHSTLKTKDGLLIPSIGSEENGNMLQACTRLSYAFKREDYAELAARITDAAVSQLLPAGRGLPAMEFDFEKDEIIQPKVKLRDHGNEMIPGLPEAFAMAVDRSSDPKWKARADRWAEPLLLMCESFLKFGRNRDGLMISAIHPRTRQILIDDPNDNWGYLLNGVLLYLDAEKKRGTMAPERIAYLEKQVDDIIQAVASHYDLGWQEGLMDGYADTLESAMYMSAYRKSSQPWLIPWLDDQMANLFKFQQEDGFSDKGYLDGNFIRTSLMYADLRSGGFTIQPWRDDVSVGFATNKAGRAVVYVASKEPYTGVLKADQARHKNFMHLPWNWPRLNSWPEWFVPTDAMRISKTTGLSAAPSIADLQKGLSISLPAGGTVTIQIETGEVAGAGN